MNETEAVLNKYADIVNELYKKQIRFEITENAATLTKTVKVIANLEPLNTEMVNAVTFTDQEYSAEYLNSILKNMLISMEKAIIRKVLGLEENLYENR